MSFASKTGRAIKGFWWLLDATRRTILNLLLLAFIVAGLWLAFNRGPAALEDKTTLVLALNGPLLDQERGGGPRDSALAQLRGGDRSGVRLRDFAGVMDAGAKDEKIVQALLLLDELGGAGLPSLREAAAAVERFKAAGKKVYAWGGNYDQRSYFLAAHASEVWLHPMGTFEVEGYGRYRNYYKDAFDRLGVQANVVRAGKYKNAAETFTNAAPSPETIESDAALYGSLWSSWLGGVERARKLPAGTVMKMVDGLPGTLAAAGNDLAKLALDTKLVDGLNTRDQMRALLVERGAEDPKNKTFRQVSFGEYVARVKPQRGGDAVAVIVAQGEISDGQAPSGRVGGLSTAGQIKKARDDDKVKAIVLRVNSPGGSAYGSELVRRELEVTRAAGKPVVVSMGDLAASGGYWISMAADEVIADEATITGSIGVVGMLPTAKGVLDKLSINTAGASTTWLGSAYDVRRELDPRFVQLVQAVVGKVYTDFTGIVAKARKTEVAKVDALGQGRVWSGKDAQTRGLVDRIGGFDDAVQAAAKLSKMDLSKAEGGKPRLQWFEVEPGRLQQLLRRFGGTLAAGLGVDAEIGAAETAAASIGLLRPVAGSLLDDLGWLADVAERRQPYAAVVHCLCGAP